MYNVIIDDDNDNNSDNNNNNGCSHSFDTKLKMNMCTRLEVLYWSRVVKAVKVSLWLVAPL